MPTIPDEFIPLRSRFALPDMPAPEDPSILDTIGAAGVSNNWVYRGWRYLQNHAQVEAEPDHDPFALIKGTKYEADPMRFAYSRTADETRAIMAEWDEDEHARDVLSRSGWTGTVAGVGMGLLDPTIFLPIAKVFSGVARGASALRLGADVAITGGASAAIGEAVMYGTTSDYTAGDVAANVGTATVLSGLLGAGAGALMSRSERAAVTDLLHADRETWGADLSRQAQSAGAAASDTRELKMRSVPGLNKLPDPTAKLSPPRRVLSSDFTSGRRAVVDLVETPYIFDENVEGVATTQGPAVSRLMTLETNRARVGMAQMFDSTFSRYRSGTEQNLMQRTMRGARDLVSTPEGGKMKFPEFKHEVDKALRNGDAHDVPEVAEAASYIRKNVLDPWKERAIKAGLLPEGVGTKTADSYMMRVWDKQRLIAERPAIARIFADWLDGEEAKKLQIQSALSDHRGRMAEYVDMIGDLERKLESKTADLAKLSTQMGEVRGVNKFAFQRAGKVRGQVDDMLDAQVLKGVDNDAQIAGARNNARGGAVFETKIRGRGNALADRASGVAAEIDDLQRRIADLTAKRDGLRGQIEELIGRWEGKSASEAKAALRARADAEGVRHGKIDAGDYKGTGGRLSSADDAIDTAVARILSKERLRDRKELEDLANEIVERLVGNPDGRLPYDRPSISNAGAAGPAMRGPLAHRDFMIPDDLVRDFLEKDAQKVSEIYLRTMVPDVLLTERFGDVDMTETFRKLQDEHVARAASASSDAQRAKIKDQYDGVVKDLAAMRDRVRGTYAYSSDPSQRFLGRMAATAARFDIITNLGGATLSSLSDLAGLQWRYGMTSTFKHAWAPFIRQLISPEARKARAAYRNQLRALGIAAETYLNSRSHSFYDVMDVYAPTSRFERAVNVAADKFGLVNMLSPWTDFAKVSAGMVSGSEISRAVEAVAAGKAKARQIRDLAEGGIDSVMAGRIWKQLSAEGGSDVIDGIRIPNTGAWSDRGAREAFEGMLARDVDLMVLTPGAEKPLMMSKPIASLILQYKTFVTAANERLLVRSLQARDHQVLSGLASAIALGTLAEYAYSHVANRPGPKDTSDWIKAGITRSGILGWYQEGNAISSKWTGGAVDMFRAIGADMPDARYISRSPGAALLGPVYGKFETTVSSLAKLAAKAAGGDQEWKANDTYQLRRLLPAQNLFLIRRLLDSVEDSFNEAIGVEPKERGRK